MIQEALKRIGSLRTARGDLAAETPDSLALEVLAGDLEAQRIRQDDVLAAARIRLGQLAGGSSDSLPDAVGDGAPLSAFEGRFEDALVEALRSRPDWRAAQAARGAARMNETLQSLRWLPEVGLIGRWSTRRATEVTDQRGSYQRDPFNGGAGGMALGIQWDIDPRRVLKDTGEAEWTARGGAALVEALRAKIVVEVREAVEEERRGVLRAQAEDASMAAADGWLDAQMRASSAAGGPVAEFVKALGRGARGIGVPELLVKTPDLFPVPVNEGVDNSPGACT